MISVRSRETLVRVAAVRAAQAAQLEAVVPPKLSRKRRVAGRLGGFARAQALSPLRRSESARKAANASAELARKKPKQPPPATVRALRDKGMSWSAVAAELGCSVGVARLRAQEPAR